MCLPEYQDRPVFGEAYRGKDRNGYDGIQKNQLTICQYMFCMRRELYQVEQSKPSN